MSGATERDIAEGLRHSSTALVKRYAHLSPSHLQGVMERVSSFEDSPSKASISNGTVTLTGNEDEQKEEEDTQVIECIGAGEEIRTPDQRLGKTMNGDCSSG